MDLIDPAIVYDNSPVLNDSLNDMPDAQESIQLILYLPKPPAGIHVLNDPQ
jgi:hypothetical protein